MGSLLKGIGSIAPAVGSIFGPVGTAVGAGVGALTSGIDSDQKAGKIEGQVSGIANGQLAGFNQYYAPLMDAYARSIGYNPSNGSFDGYTGTSTTGTGSGNSAQLTQLQSQRDALAKSIAAYTPGVNSVSTGTGGAGGVGGSNAFKNSPAQLMAQEARTKQLAALDAQISSIKSSGSAANGTTSSSSTTAKPYGDVSATPYGAVSATPYGATSATPYGAVSADPYGDSSENSYMGNYGTQRYNQAANQIDKASDQAVAQIGADALARGFVGHNTASNSQIAAARVAEGQNLSNTKASLMQAGDDEMYRRDVANNNAAWDRNAQNVNTAWNQNVANNDTAWNRNAQNVNTAWTENAANVDEQNRRMASFLQMLGTNANSSLGTLSSIGGQYASQSNAMGQGLGSLLGLITNSGATGVGSKVKIGTPPIAQTNTYAPPGNYNVANWADYSNLG